VVAALTAAAAGVVVSSPASPANALTQTAPSWAPGPQGGPDGRVGAAMSYDAALSADVLFGGVTDHGLAPSANDTWSWNGRSWTQAHPLISPSARTAASMAYDSASRQLLLFGGGNSNEDGSLATQSDTWSWTGRSWLQLHPGANPLARLAASMAYDPGNGTVVLFGGADAGGDSLADTWVWNGHTWTQAHPATVPERRVSAMMASDPVNGDVVMFGGIGGVGQTLDDTWLWNGTNWSQLEIPSTPPARSSGTMDFDSSLGAVVLTGGADAAAADDGLSSAPASSDGAGGAGGVLADTWSFDGSTWSSIASGAPAVDNASAAFDVASSQFVVFGGVTAQNGSEIFDSPSASDPVSSPTDIAPPDSSPPDDSADSGPSSIGTSVAVSQASVTSGAAKAVVLVRADQVTDAITAGSLAAFVGGPLLLSDPHSLTSSVRTEIRRALPAGGTVYLIGGPSALSPVVQSALVALGYRTQRIAGADRFATAVAIANQLGHSGAVFEVAADDIADAVSGVPAAIQAHAPILLTDGAKPAAATTAYLDADQPAQRFALGGDAAAADRAAAPIVGADRYATSALIASTFFVAPGVIGLASSYSDALPAGVDLGAQSAPLLLVPASGSLPVSTAHYLNDVQASVGSATVFGGTNAVSQSLADQVGVALSSPALG
jgi:hypothetical protein